ncbi:bifunctional 2-C-methyl-D-erythritol 4-phosphate cytidylyltransferase/2-C-methyl-D-erythritol 2,4-cyclodiphosphate synthase [Mesobaculum littorinae]|uniref:Bifunctional enzyme IspD/IspF n=2 Tax=Mesobaculum littorinae TaxID=2486419 RepID=A0A438AMY9_9RHOB|nr:bifunctional 2-C-methyl-D-erythritol 4-phosphate cytidylyltransferase/2-C-methyl-D-erythritol 2,4-cyclodiphosphate synthase [Mesobaculum littorinae]
MTEVVIVAAGRGRRAGGPFAKQWQTLRGRRIADLTLDAFLAAPGIGRIAVVLHPDDLPLAEPWTENPRVLAVPGGDTRADSVRRGLEALAPGAAADARVLIHDVARPLVSHALIARVIAALQAAPGAAPALPVTDALWRGDGDDDSTGNRTGVGTGIGIGARVVGTVDRTGLFRAQTPQGFHLDAILRAHRVHPGGAADDVEVARAAGLEVVIVEGEERNLKITAPGDFARALGMMEADLDIRTGNGFDVHAFGDGDHVTLCGVAVPHDRGLSGHSDADVGMHALTDAIYGALAAGDIGRHFPPSDPQWKGAESRIFLAHAAALAAERGYRIGNADVTLMCERPKIGPHADAMAAALAGILGTASDRVSVKATTTERLGFTGREEGIAAMATVTLVQG